MSESELLVSCPVPGEGAAPHLLRDGVHQHKLFLPKQGCPPCQNYGLGLGLGLGNRTVIVLVGNTLGLELKKFEDGWYYNLNWIKKCLEVFGIGIGIQRPCKYWDWDWDWERGNFYKIFGIGLGIGILNAYNLEIGIEPCKVNRSKKFWYTKKMSNKIIYSDCLFTLAGKKK